MAESVVSGVAERLGNLLLQEANFLSGVSHQVEMLQNELKLMQSFLKVADTKQDESDLVRQLVAQIRDLAYDAEDIIATYALKVGSRGVKRCACILGEGITVHQVGSKIDVIKTRISNLKQSFQDYGIEKSTIQAGRLSSLNEMQREQRQTFSHPEHDVVGFNDGLNKLVNFLLKEEGGKRVASICGMGGLGKTTLAKMVYNDPKVKQYFNCCSWVYISQQCQRRPVLEEILTNLLSQSQKDEIRKSDEVDIIKKLKDGIRKLDEVDIINKLYQVQFDQKCLVVLDDIWNEEVWNKLCEAFPKEATNSKILLTSRNQQVCQHVDPGGFHYQLQHLNDVESLELLEKIAISGREGTCNI